jgi:hypothetical protein
MAVSKRTRYEVLRRDNHTCRYCGGSAPDVVLTVDHVTPTALGGNDDPSNLVAACRDCNAGKASTSPDAAFVDDVAQDALRWSAAIKLAAYRAAAKHQQIEDYIESFWDEFKSYYPDSKSIYTPILPEGWEASVETFYVRGLPLGMLHRALAKTVTKPRLGRYDFFRYLCGICWSMLSEIQDEAQGILEREGE